jgi:hypothetical protein
VKDESIGEFSGEYTHDGEPIMRRKRKPFNPDTAKEDSKDFGNFYRP